MKILYVTTIGITMGFFQDLVLELVTEGHTVDICCNDKESAVPDFYHELGCRVFSVSLSRSPFKYDNLKAIKDFKKIVTENRYDIVHCHTPVAAFCTRLACAKVRKTGTKVFYTAHGFHFYKGAPLKNWLVFYPVERFLSRYTDVLITINKEDYERAKTFKAKQVEYVPGVGVDCEKFLKMIEDREHIRMKLREQLGIPADAKVLLSIGEINANKNHKVVINCLPQLDNVCYVICGRGPLMDEHRKLAESLDVADRLILTGYRTDVADFYNMADVFVFPSRREGLGLALVEAMASGLICVASITRGTKDLMPDSELLFEADDAAELERKLKAALSGDFSHEIEINRKTADRYDISRVIHVMKNLYVTNNKR